MFQLLCSPVTTIMAPKVPFQWPLRFLSGALKVDTTSTSRAVFSLRRLSTHPDISALRVNCIRNGLSSRALLRSLSTSQVLSTENEMVDVTFITPDGTKHKTKGKLGDNLLDVVINNSIDLDGFGACEGTLACSTCHLVFKQDDFDRIKDKITDEELDMLDLAYGLTERSRLGCQVTLTKDLAGVEVEVPAGVNDARS